jgi:hypothetical protein
VAVPYELISDQELLKKVQVTSYLHNLVWSAISSFQGGDALVFLSSCRTSYLRKLPDMYRHAKLLLPRLLLLLLPLLLHQSVTSLVTSLFMPVSSDLHCFSQGDGSLSAVLSPGAGPWPCSPSLAP